MSIIIPANSAASGGYEVDNSARFESNTYMTKSTSSGNTKTFTISFWCKRTALGAVASGSNQFPISFYQDGSNRLSGAFLTNNTFIVYAEVGGSTKINFSTNRVFRDTSAWMHFVIKVDTTQGTEANRFKLYINGVEETSFSASTYPSQDQELTLNTNLYLGTYETSSNFFHGYLAETVFIDGTAYDPTSFGEFDEDSGIWKPKNVSGLTAGTNGFYLDFEDSSNLGNDVFGGTDLTEYNFTAVDQSTDTCTNNFATLNPLNQISSVAYSEGNLKFTNSSSTNRLAFANFAMTSGKFYCEMKVATLGANFTHIGLRNIGSYTLTNAYVNDPTNEKVSYLNDGRVFISGAETSSMPTYTSGDIIGMACDMDNGYLYYHKNGTYINSGNPASGGSGSGGFDIYNHGNVDYCFAVSNSDGGTDPVIDANFGSPPFAISSGNTDANDFGNFEYTVPTGYFALCSKNLSEFA